MIIDFFDDTHKTESNQKTFGLCDEPNVDKPAYIDETDCLKWIATVNNQSEKMVSFYPIDRCLVWKRPDGKESGKCDGMLSYNQKLNIIFVELKDRKLRSADWRQKAKKQLIVTWEMFKNIYPRSMFQNIEAYICNKQQATQEQFMQLCQEFLNETGITLRVRRMIEIKG